MSAGRGRLARLLRIVAAMLMLVVAVSSGCGSTRQVRVAQPTNLTSPVCGFWYGIGASPSPAEAAAVARRYGVVVLNSWDQPIMKLIKSLNPSAKVLVYKDLSSTRNYAGAVANGGDAARLPTGVGYEYASRNHPDWFASDAQGRRIEWDEAYPQHWQMAVWNPAYQRYWADRVTKEVVSQGWDGVLADNDFYRLQFYSSRLLKGTGSAEQTNAQIRRGLDKMVGIAGSELNQAGKLFVPNISEARMTPGRWTSHSRFGGGMEENFATTGTGALLPFDSPQWNEMRSTAARGDKLLLLVTAGASPQTARTGYASAALLAGPKTCWMSATTSDYSTPTWTPEQNSPLGAATGRATHTPSGVWTRGFLGGSVAVNPTDHPASVSGADANNGGPVRLPARSGTVAIS